MLITNYTGKGAEQANDELEGELGRRRVTATNGKPKSNATISQTIKSDDDLAGWGMCNISPRKATPLRRGGKIFPLRFNLRSKRRSQTC